MFDKQISNINDLAHKYNYKQEKQNTKELYRSSNSTNCYIYKSD